MDLFSLMSQLNVILSDRHIKPRLERVAMDRRNFRIPMTGVDVIDKDHIGIIDLINNVSEEANRDNFYEFSMMILDYINVHLKKEEALMQEVEYPGYKMHHLEHSALRNIIAVYIKPTGDNKKSIREAVKECREIFRNHIQSHDMPLAKYIKDRNLTHG